MACRRTVTREAVKKSGTETSATGLPFALMLLATWRGCLSRRFFHRFRLSLPLLLVLLYPIAAPAKDPVKAQHAMVVAQEHLAADVGAEILKQGGNAVDAAVAVGFALAVSHPQAGNLGGGGFVMIRMADGRTAFLDFREMAPAKATRDMYLGPDGNPTRDSIVGWRAAGVPGSPLGLEEAHKRFGKKPWRDLVLPAIKLARDGFPVEQGLAEAIKGSTKSLSADPESTRVFLRGGYGYQLGEVLKQPDLAATLERIAANGAKEFYQGQTAEKIASEMKKHGGLITLEDLKAYRVIKRKPLEGDYRGYHFFVPPPPSAGGVGMLQMLGMLEGSHYDAAGPDSPSAVHYVAEVMRRFYADRSEYLGDPDFYNVPVRALLDPKYIASRKATIDPDHATPSDLVQPGLPTTAAAHLHQYEGNETTHFNVVDSDGNAVSLTYTLNAYFGNGVTVAGTGVLLNDEMDDFAAKPGVPNMFGVVGGDANSIEPGKRPLSSMTPTIITKDGKLFMAVGAPGGSRITTGVLQVILDVIDFHLNAQDAVDLPRFHHQWRPDVLYLQKNFNKDTNDALAKMGYTIKPVDGVARVEAIVVRDGVLEGGTETRAAGWNSGKAAGY
jgi:gamma-glutamyltranspeptidase / glutathione hydrolase